MGQLSAGVALLKQPGRQPLQDHPVGLMMMLSVEQAVTPKPRYSRPGAQLPTVHPGIELPSALSVQVAAAGRNASGSSSAAMKRWRIVVPG